MRTITHDILQQASVCFDTNMTFTNMTQESSFKIQQLLSITVCNVYTLRAALCRLWTVAQGNKILYGCATFSMDKTES